MAMSDSEPAIEPAPAGVDPDTKETLQEIASAFSDLQGRVRELEDRLEAYEDLVELRGIDGPEEAGLEHIWIAGHPVGKLVDRNNVARKKLEKRLDRLEAGEIDPQNLGFGDVEGQLPIQTRTAERKAGQLQEEGNEKNLYRATFVWTEFPEHSHRESGLIKLPSEQVRNILDEYDLPTDNMTKIRVMKTLARHTDRDGEKDDPAAESNLVRFQNRKGTSVLVADRDEWEQFFGEQEKQVREEAAAQFDQLESAEVEADD